MKQKTGINSVLKKAGIGVAAACGASFLVCCVLSLLVLREALPADAAPLAAVVGTGLCVFGACYQVVRGVPQSKLPISMGMALAFLLVCLAVKAAALPREELSLQWTAAVPLAAAAVAGLLASKKKRRRR